MTKVLFWNIRRRPLQRLIADLARSHDLDLILLTESEIPEVELIAALQITTDRTFEFLGEMPGKPTDFGSRIHVFSSLTGSVVAMPTFRKQPSRIKIFRLNESHPLELDTLLVVTHAPSKLHADHVDRQRRFFRRLRSSILAAERTTGHRNTVLVGDLNVDPFEEGVASVQGIQGVMSRVIARQERRRYDGRDHRFFYNPTWSLYGQRLGSGGGANAIPGQDEPETPGTYYYHKGLAHALFWHMHDQVLVRPALIDRFPVSEFQIVGRASGESLVTREGSPTPSDHLPLFFQLDLLREVHHVA